MSNNSSFNSSSNGKDATKSLMMKKYSVMTLLPLSFWFLWTIACLVKEDFVKTVSFVSSPYCITLMLMFIFSLLYSLLHDFFEMIDDYVKCRMIKFSITFLMYFIVAALSILFIITAVNIQIFTIK